MKLKPIDVKDNTWIGSIKEVNDKDPKSKVDEYIKIQKHFC